ncbi:OmpA family protein [Sulfurimonas sp.]|nr:OmpA family protein [Sulfurimonas sp.]
MKSIILSSAVVALLVLTGCSSKEASLSDAEKAAQEQAAQKETVVVNAVDQEIVDSNTMTSVEKEFTAVYFDFDKFSINADNKSKIGTSANIVNTSAKSFSVKLEGNCDEWGSDEYNFALGLKRANAVKKSLVANGVDESRITMVSYGESNPICSDKTQACWSKNRRVDFKLLP